MPMKFNPAHPTPYDEQRKPDHRLFPLVYCTKVLTDGTIEAYDRAYKYLGNLTHDGMLWLNLNARVTESWADWTGGRTEEPGRAHWWTSIASGNLAKASQHA